MTTTTGHPYTPVPEAFTAASGSTIAAELPLYAVHLQAENKSPATVSLWTGAARQLHAYRQDDGMPTDVRAIRREHLESWLADLLRLLLGSGLRREELATMTTGSLNIPMRSVTVRRKGGRTESTYVPPKALTALGRYERARRMHRFADTDAYWLGKVGPITGWGVYQIVEKRAAAASERDAVLAETETAEQERRASLLAAVEALAEARTRHAEALALREYLTGRPDARFKVLGGYLRNLPRGGNGAPPPAWESVLGMLRQDAAEPVPPEKPAYAQPLQPAERVIGPALGLRD